MPNVLIKNKDGTYDGTFSSRYIVRPGPTVINLKTGRTLQADSKKHVTLSCGGHTRSVNVERLWSNTLEFKQYPGKIVISEEGTIDMYLKGYRWRIPAQARIGLGDSFLHELTPLPCMGDAEKLLNLIQAKRTHDSLPNQCSFYHLLDWSRQYTDELRGLPEAYGLYRDLHQFTFPFVVDKQVISYQSGRLYLLTDGSLQGLSDTGKMRALYPEGDTLTGYSSKLLANNRLTLQETNGLISGPYTPLIAWTFRGLPREGEVLFNITGNTKDFSAANFTWVPKEKVYAYVQFRQWLTRRWHYEMG